MAKVTLSDEVVFELLYGSGVKKNPDNRFNLPVRSNNIEEQVEEGDIIYIPEDYEVLNVVKEIRGVSVSIPFIMVNVSNEKTGAEKKVRFFPNQLAKVVYPVSDDGKRMARIATRGTAAEYYATFRDVDSAMESLKGKKIKVVTDSVCRTERYGDRCIVNTHIYRYDFVDKIAEADQKQNEYLSQIDCGSNRNGMRLLIFVNGGFVKEFVNPTEIGICTHCGSFGEERYVYVNDFCNRIVAWPFDKTDLADDEFECSIQKLTDPDFQKHHKFVCLSFYEEEINDLKWKVSQDTHTKTLGESVLETAAKVIGLLTV